MSNERKTDLCWLGAAILFALIAFFNTVENGFVFDDHFLIENNPSLKDSGYISRVFNPAPQDSPVTDSPTVKTSFSAYYRPFTRALFALVYQGFGLNPWGWHAVNLSLYLIVVALAFLLLRRLAMRVEIYGPATLLFALHPIHSESVSWANCLVETLHAIFYLTACLFFIYSRQATRRSQSLGFFITSVLAALAAMFCKETAVTLPILAAGYIFLVEDRDKSLLHRFRAACLITLPYLSIVGIYFMLRHRAGGGLQMASAGNLGATLRTLPLVVTKYLSLLVFPINLSPAYPTRPVAAFLSIKFIAPLLLLLGLTLIIYKYYFESSLLRVAWLIMILPLLPVLNTGMLLPELIVQDRYLFLPSLGFCLILGVIYAHLPEKGALPRRAILALVLVCYAAATIKQNTYWYNDQTLFAHAVKIDPTSSFSYINLAASYVPDGDLVNAERYFAQALRYNPNCGICYASLGDFRFQQQQFKQGVDFYREAILMGYQEASVFNNFIVGSLRIGQAKEAIATFEQIARVQPENVDIFFLLGVANEQSGNIEAARRHYQQALQLYPEHQAAKAALLRLKS